jgi:hypothetical protein
MTRFADFKISTAHRNGLLYLKAQIPETAGRDDINQFMVDLAGAFAAVEQTDPQQMLGMLFGVNYKIKCEECSGVMISREYTDAAYPIRVDAALSKLRRGARVLH